MLTLSLVRHHPHRSCTGVEKTIFLAIVEEVRGWTKPGRPLQPIAVSSRFNQPITGQLDRIGIGRGRIVAQFPRLREHREQKDAARSMGFGQGSRDSLLLALPQSGPRTPCAVQWTPRFRRRWAVKDRQYSGPDLLAHR